MKHNPTIHTTSDTLDQSAGTATHALKFSKVAAAYMAELAKGTVAGAANDTTPPMASITSPSAGATVAGTTTLSVSAADDVGVKRVEFWVDGALKGVMDPVGPAAEIAGVTAESDDGLFLLRHSSAHVMATAIQELYPGTKFAIGPPIADGF